MISCTSRFVESKSIAGVKVEKIVDIYGPLVMTNRNLPIPDPSRLKVETEKGKIVKILGAS